MQNLNFQFSIFGEFMVKLNATNTLKIQSTLNDVTSDIQFFQSFSTGFNVDIVKNQVVQTKDISYITENNKISLNLTQNRIDLNLSQIDLDDTITQNAKKYFDILFENLDLIPNRLAFNTTIIKKEFYASEEKKILNEYIKPIEFYSNDEFLEEWSVRFNKVHTLSLKQEEKINVITQLTKVKNTDDPTRLAVMWQTDINTNENDVQPRFTNEDFDVFIDYAIGKHQNIIN